MGVADGRLIALDQATGKPAWQIQAERWQDGYAITAAPRYFDGKVIIGFNGGETGTRGRLKASDAWTRGGANIWQTPAVDPELGLIYFSTANPGPDLNGSVREADNLFANACLACLGVEGTGGHGGGPTLIGKIDAAQMHLITTVLPKQGGARP